MKKQFRIEIVGEFEIEVEDEENAVLGIIENLSGCRLDSLTENGYTLTEVRVEVEDKEEG